MNRKLASIQKIKSIQPIEGADRIEMAQILNWECVIKKDEFHVGDLVIYFEIDSLLPEVPMFEWLKNSSWYPKLNKYKIHTQKLRGQISQGLIISLDLLKDLVSQVNGELPYNPIFPHDEGDDLTELLQIKKYEPPLTDLNIGRIISHEWYVPKTDEERIQVCADTVLPNYMNASSEDWYATIKLDGTSCTAGLFEDGFLIGGREQWYIDANMYTTTVKSYGDIEKKLKDYLISTGKYIVFQGELCGPNIQSNHLGLIKYRWYIFNAFSSTTGKYDSYKKCDLFELQDLCKIFGLEMVPIITIGDGFDFKATTDINETVNNLLKYADNFIYKTYFENASPNQTVEGIVFRMNDMTNSFKVISNKFLLKGGE